MLVLSRRSNESVLFPNLGISVKVVKLNNDRVRLGIDAPANIQVLRNEIHDPQVDPEKFQLVDKTLLPQIHSRLNVLTDQLYGLHDYLLETDDPRDAELLIYKLFLELKSLDDVVLANQGPDREEAAQQGTKRTALLVEDNQNEARLLAGFLRCREFDVEVASNGAEAMEYLDRCSSTPDCVLLDMNMPKYNGEWTVNEIRSKPRYNRLNVFAMSGNELDEFDIKIAPSSVNRWFTKPLDPEALIKQIDAESQPKTGRILA